MGTAILMSFLALWIVECIVVEMVASFDPFVLFPPAKDGARGNMGDYDQSSCYPLIDVISPLVDFRERFANHLVGEIKEYPFVLPTTSDFDFKNISVWIDNDPDVTFSYSKSDLTITIPVGRTVILNGEVFFKTTDNSTQYYSARFRNTLKESVVKITLPNEEGERIKYHLVTNEIILNYTGAELGDSENDSKIDNLLSGEVENCLKRFESWLEDSFGERLYNILKTKIYKLEDQLAMLEIPRKQGLCANVAEMPREFLSNHFFASDHGFKRNVTSLVMNGYQNIISIKFYNGSKNDPNRFKISMNGDCSNSDPYIPYDCETFLLYHHFELEIHNVLDAVGWCDEFPNDEPDNEYEKCCIRMRISGRASRTSIEMRNVTFMECADYTSSSPFLCQNCEESLLSQVRNMFSPLRRADEDLILMAEKL